MPTSADDSISVTLLSFLIYLNLYTIKSFTKVLPSYHYSGRGNFSSASPIRPLIQPLYKRMSS